MATGQKRKAPEGEEGPDRALIVKKHWCEQIFHNTKVWEIRSKPTSRSLWGRICIAQSKAKQLVGEVDIVDCIRVGRRSETGQFIPWTDSPDDLRNFIGSPENLHKHCIADLATIPYPKLYAWVMDNKEHYSEPKDFEMPRGAVVWVNLKKRAKAATGSSRA